MKEALYETEYNDDDNPLISKAQLLKYFHYWPWFLISTFLALFLGYLYMRYSPSVYASIAKIKIMDESKQLDLASDVLSPLAMYSKVNLDNEIEVIKSYRLLSQVVDELDLDISYYDAGAIKTTEIWSAPFVVEKNIPEDSLTSPLSFKIALDPSGIKVENDAGIEYSIRSNASGQVVPGLPITISLREGFDLSKFDNINYKVVLWPKKQAVLDLSNLLYVEPTNRKGEILSIWMWGESPERSEDILNVVIDKFNQDGVLDRQLVSKRTLGFIDERFIYLSGQLDSIEVGKQDFKQENNLSYLDEDVSFTLRKRSIAEEEVAKLQMQLSLSRLLKQTIQNEDTNSLLPSDIGLENSSINTLVSNYNELALQRSKLMTSVGESHPSLQALNSQLQRGRQNILKTVDVYQQQIRTSLGRYSQASNNAGDDFSRLPEKEKMLRAIERQQNIKERLYILLLQKREEAAINYAVTAPSIKVIDYGRTTPVPVSPKKLFVYPLALFLGLFMPLGLLFVRFWLDTKIHNRSDIVRRNPEIPILGEIPYLEDGRSFIEADDRSILAESFRILGTNIDYQLSAPVADIAKVIYVTSSVNGEGKTLTALNLSLGYASLKKRVLLVGCDLRNPQLHKYFNIDKSMTGISDYLNNSLVDFDDCIHKGFGKNSFHKVCFSGQVPSNPPQLLASKRFEEFIDISRKSFDYVIVDTAPTILVADTMLISKHADLTLFVVRAGFTDKQLLEYSKNLNKSGKLLNMSYVINNVGEGSHHEYNYGYGYGYGNEKSNHSWPKDFLDKVKSDGIIQAISTGFNGFKDRIKARLF